jgi:uncharacterized protein HemX
METQNNQNGQLGETNNIPNFTNPNKKTQIGPIIGLLIILTIIVIGTLYFWGQRIEKIKNKQDIQQTIQTQDQNMDVQIKLLKEQSDSDSVESIEADLNATDFENIDFEIEQI